MRFGAVSSQNSIFLPQATPEDIRFRRDLLQDLDDWITSEMTVVMEKLSDRETATPPARLQEIISGHILYICNPFFDIE